MRVPNAKLLRKHWQSLLILPLVVIMMTWPTFARIFDSDEFWLHSQNQYDALQKFWDAWHLERFLTGKTSFYYTDAMFHPPGVSLVFHGASTPHAFLLLLLQQLIPVDDAYSLLYLLMLCFNGFCAYLLIHHLFKDRWIALFGAVVVGVHVYFTYVVTAPDVLMMGTVPLTLYFMRRSVMESRPTFALLAGASAGVTAFISLYVFVVGLTSVGIYAIYLSIQFWRDPSFWRRALIMVAVCASISLVRIYPIIADAAALKDGLSYHLESIHSGDVLRFLVHSRNPFTGDFLHAALGATHEVNFKYAYLGYINLAFIVIALLRAPLRRKLAVWLVMLVTFAVMSLGAYLTYNRQAHTNIVLPEAALTNLFPAIFGSIGNPTYYILGIVTPLAVLSCYGLSQALLSKGVKTRAAIVTLSILILAIEYYQRPAGSVIEREKTSYISWLQTEDNSAIKVIHLPQGRRNSIYYMYMQSLSSYASAYGYANRQIKSANTYINNNLLLRLWRNHQLTVCLPGHTSTTYIAALDQLLQDGFTHIVLHHWRIDDEDLGPSFANVPVAYEDEFVSVYRLADMRRNCEAPSTLPRIDRFTRSPWVIPGDGASIISYHPAESVEQYTLAYLGLLFSDWDSFHHLYRKDGEWVTQSAGPSDAHGDDSARKRRIVHLTYDVSDGPPRLPERVEFRDDFNLCRREAYENGAVIELYFNRQFSCALINSDSSLRVEYDNGALLQNLLYDFNQDVFDLQIYWRNLPDKTHSLSVQIFDAAGEKARGQDFVIGSRSITRHIVDLSALPPGDYVVKLIFYRYSTGKSVSGTISSSGARFDRELEFATIRKS